MNLIEGTPQQENQSAIAIVHEYAGLAWRNKWLIVGCLALSMGLALMYCFLAPQYYRSESLILVEEPKLLENVVQGTVDGKLEQRIFLIQRQIANRDVLAEIGREFDLYPKGLNEEEEALTLQRLTNMVKVEMVKKELTGNFTGHSGIEAFTVSFMHNDPGMAMQVTNRIAEKFVEQNTREREKDAEGTSEFLDDELRAIKLELEKKEDQISRFKTTHIGELPQQTDANLRTLDRLQSEINTVNEDLQRHSDRLTMLDKGLQDYRLYGRHNPALSSSLMGPDPLYQRLHELRGKIIKLKAEFWDEYPEVIVTKEEIRQVEQELVELYGPDAINPDKKPRDPYIQDLENQQSQARSEVNLLKERLRLLLASRKDHERRVERFPEVEQELLILERDYNNMKSNYAMLLDKRLHARVKENMEKRQKGGKFRILDRASFPLSPAIPNRPRILVLAFLFGCVFGVGSSVMRERLSPQFRGPDDVELLIGPRLLAAIPDFSFLWNPTKAQGYFPNAYMPRRSYRGIAGSKFGVADADRLQALSGNGFSIEKRFVTKVFPRSMAAEQYRVAAARLQLLNAGTGSTVIVVTSAIKGEGKTTTVVNLGYTLARDFGKRVLIVDCDFVYPELKCFIEKPTLYGLVDCLRGNAEVDEAMSPLSDVPCWIMPAGESEMDPTELLRTGQFERILPQLREKFDYILLNAPPILPVATMNVLEKYVDILLLVVRANLTSQQVVKRALGSLRASKPVHAILNGVHGQALPYYMTEYSLLESREHV